MNKYSNRNYKSLYYINDLSDHQIDIYKNKYHKYKKKYLDLKAGSSKHDDVDTNLSKINIRFFFI